MCPVFVFALFIQILYLFYNFDIICISETFLDSDNSADDQKPNLEGYVMVRSDHPSNTKRGGV